MSNSLKKHDYVTLRIVTARSAIGNHAVLPGPTFTFAFIVATLLGAVFHLIVGGDARRLAVFLLGSWLGFALGQLAGASMAIDLLMMGDVRMFAATTGALIALIMAYIFTGDRTRRRSAR